MAGMAQRPKGTGQHLLQFSLVPLQVVCFGGRGKPTLFSAILAQRVVTEVGCPDTLPDVRITALVAIAALLGLPE